MSEIDGNYEGVAKGVTDDANATPAPFLVDPITGRLLVVIACRPATEAVHTYSPIDQNYEGVAMGEDGSGNPIPFHTDSEGCLLVDIA